MGEICRSMERESQLAKEMEMEWERERNVSEQNEGVNDSEKGSGRGHRLETGKMQRLGVEQRQSEVKVTEKAGGLLYHFFHSRPVPSTGTQGGGEVGVVEGLAPLERCLPSPEHLGVSGRYGRKGIGKPRRRWMRIRERNGKRKSEKVMAMYRKGQRGRRGAFLSGVLVGPVGMDGRVKMESDQDGCRTS